MKDNKKYVRNKRNKILIFSAIILVTVFMLAIGYSAFSAELHIASIAARIRADKVVRINGVTTSSGNVSDLDYSQSSVINNVTLAPGASITYNVDVTNLGNVPVAVSNVHFTNGNTPINTLSANINSANYVKICDNGTCTGPVTKLFL